MAFGGGGAQDPRQRGSSVAVGSGLPAALGHPGRPHRVTLLPGTQGRAEDGCPGGPGMFGFSRVLVVPGGGGRGCTRSSDRGAREGPRSSISLTQAWNPAVVRPPEMAAPIGPEGRGRFPWPGRGHGEWARHNAGGRPPGPGPGRRLLRDAGKQSDPAVASVTLPAPRAPRGRDPLASLGLQTWFPCTVPRRAAGLACRTSSPPASPAKPITPSL